MNRKLTKAQVEKPKFISAIDLCEDWLAMDTEVAQLRRALRDSASRLALLRHEHGIGGVPDGDTMSALTEVIEGIIEPCLEARDGQALSQAEVNGKHECAVRGLRKGEVPA